MNRFSLPMATTTLVATMTSTSNPGILQPPRPPHSSLLTSSSTSNSPDGSASSASSSHTSLSDLPSRSHSSASTSKPTLDSSARNPTSPRRIRFAPLPDPRRAVLITDDGDEVFIPVPDENMFSTSLLLPHTPLAAAMSISSAAAESCDPDPPLLNDDGAATSSSSSTNESYLSSNSSSSASNPRTATPSEYSPMSSVGSSPVIRDTTALPPVGNSASAPVSASPSAWLKPRSLNLLHTFRRSTASLSGSSTHSLTPTSSIDNPARAPTPPNTNGKSSTHIRATRKVLSLSPEEILTLGTINLFRTSSRDSAGSSSTAINTTSGWALKRWSSSSASSSSNTNGSPLAKTQSAQSYKSKSLFSLGGSGSSTSSLDAKSTSAKPKPPPSKPYNRHKGTRMLNGRVYGSKHTATLAANPFATARDEEPEFVEWGYGGMGSVKGAKSAGVASGGVNWERLHGGSTVREGVGVGDGDGDGEEEDDGSGIGWVKKRKEERERKERERLAALEAEKQKEQQGPELSESNVSTPTPTRTSTMDGFKSGATSNDADVTTVAGPVLEETITDEPGFISPSLGSAATIVPASYPFSPQAVEEVKEVEDEVDNLVLPNGLLLASRSKESLKDTIDEAVNAKETTTESETQHPQEHAPDIVPVPAWSGIHHHHHHHHHSGSHHRRHGHGHARTPSMSPGLTPTPLEGASAINGDVIPVVEDASAAAAAVAVASTSKAENHSDENDNSSSSSASSMSSDSEDEELGGDEEDEDEDEEDEDEDEEDEDEDEEDEDEDEKARHEARRKTALGAGVEKVMRHKEHE
ncbi:hypothetical protein M413DRAFT_110386 [Hebeloma cylindrosporum]|uniref:Uncharacterized protein n=1 Tax=Hebeloma cylindrosporum TaxID=76867 RepID=A0A0C3D081_HEBCY|nr:hypothetical protein M413DRAFT_110386 [Hebeloma cylindrosporum h7]